MHAVKNGEPVRNDRTIEFPVPPATQTADMVEYLSEMNRLIRSQEKVCLFIDNSNLFHALKSMNLGNRRLDYIKLRDVLADGRTATVRFYYSSPDLGNLVTEDRLRQAKRNKFYDFLGSNLGYHMVELPLRERTINENGAPVQVPVEKGLDCEIVYDMAILSRAGRYNTFVLVAGDEDYARTVRRIRSETGLSVEVAFFSSVGCSSILMKEASRFVDLSHVNLRDDLFREYKMNEAI